MPNTPTFSNPRIRVALWILLATDVNPNPRINYRCEFLASETGALVERCQASACLEACLLDGTRALCCLACAQAAVKSGLVENSGLRYAPSTVYHTLEVYPVPDNTLTLSLAP